MIPNHIPTSVPLWDFVRSLAIAALISDSYGENACISASYLVRADIERRADRKRVGAPCIQHRVQGSVVPKGADLHGARALAQDCHSRLIDGETPRVADQQKRAGPARGGLRDGCAG